MTSLRDSGLLAHPAMASAPFASRQTGQTAGVGSAFLKPVKQPSPLTPIESDTLHFGSKSNPSGKAPGDIVHRHVQKHGFLPHTPEQALELNWEQLAPLLETKIGTTQFNALMAKQPILSPRVSEKNGEWLKQSKIIGVHPRIVGTYLGIVKYAMTFPEDTIHLLPVRTPGAGNSLYAPIRWDTSAEMMDPELSQLGFDTPEKQLKWAINALHAMGKSVGLDIQPHMDRFAEPVFTHPEAFEWALIDKSSDTLALQSDDLSDGVKQAVTTYLMSNPPEGVSAPDILALYASGTSEEKRGQILF
jgi:hypothetical protein